MKNKSLRSSVMVMLLISLVASASSSAFAATVSSMISRGVSQNELGESINVVYVKCSASTKDPRFIVNKVGERGWCSADIPTICSRNKISAANKVCKSGFTKDIEEYKSGSSDQQTSVDSTESSTVLNKAQDVQPTEAITAQSQEEINRVALEKERISIEQQKLQIRRQELELNKRRLELERQSATQ